MLTESELLAIAAARLEDAQILLANSRHDGARYICGYALELALKARICGTLGWAEYPATRKEFENLTSFKTHNLDILLRLSGREHHVKANFFFEWSIINAWNPESRYEPAGTVSPVQAQEFLSAAVTLTSQL